MKVKPVEKENVVVGYLMESPMTGDMYCFYTKESGQQTYWDFNGDLEKPTFKPSMMNWNTKEHFVVTDGKIQYLTGTGTNPIIDMIDIE
jgi:hypothetical protein